MLICPRYRRTVQQVPGTIVLTVSVRSSRFHFSNILKKRRTLGVNMSRARESVRIVFQ